MKVWISLCIGLLFACPLQAGPLGKGSPKAAKSSLSKAHQAALRHAQALRGISPSSYSQTPLTERELQQRMEQLSKQIEWEQKRQKPFWRKTWEGLPDRKTPQMWLQLINDYIFQYRKFPPSTGDDEILYKNYSRLIANLPSTHPVAEQLKELRKKYPCKNASTPDPQAWLEKLKTFVEQNDRLPRRGAPDPQERDIAKGIYYTLRRLDLQDPIAQAMREIRQGYPYVRRRPPQEWLEQLENFVAQNGRIPSRNSQDPQEVALLVATKHVLERLDPQDPIAMRIREIWQQTAPPRRRPNEWIALLEDFVAKNDRLPSYFSQDPQERALTKGMYHIVFYFDPESPYVQQVRQIQRPYTQMPEKLLQRLENFVAQRGYFPRASSLEGEEWELYRQTRQMLSQLEPQDPVAVRIRELQR